MGAKVYRQDTLSTAQTIMVQRIEPGSTVLEMGCATGHMTRYLSEDLECRVTAVEICEEQAAEAAPYADRLIVADIAQDSTWELLGTGYDYVIYADVLEHLADPWEALRRTHSVLNKGGLVLASLPNIAHISIRLGLLMGRFDYTSYGILDDSHLRFFTARTSRELFESSGFSVDRFSGVYRKRHRFILSSLFPNAFALQFVVAASALS